MAKSVKANNSLKKNSKYKIFQDIDLARNDLYNVTKIQGNQFPESDNNDLTITTWDSKQSTDNVKSANVLIRAGKGKDLDFSKDGYVHLYAGNDEEPLSSTSDPLANDFDGIRINPDSSVDVRFKNTRLKSDTKVAADYNEIEATTHGQVKITTESSDNPQKKVIITNNTPVELTTNKQVTVTTTDPVSITAEATSPVTITTKDAVTINTSGQTVSGEVTPVTITTNNPVNYTSNSGSPIEIVTNDTVTATSNDNIEATLNAPTTINNKDNFQIISSGSAGKLTVQTVDGSLPTVVDLHTIVDVDTDKNITVDIAGASSTLVANIDNASTTINTKAPVTINNTSNTQYISKAAGTVTFQTENGNNTTTVDINTPLDIDTSKNVAINLNGSSSTAAITIDNASTEFTDESPLTAHFNDDVNLDADTINLDIESILTPENKDIDEVDLDITSSTLDIGTNVVTISGDSTKTVKGDTTVTLGEVGRDTEITTNGDVIYTANGTGIELIQATTNIPVDLDINNSLDINTQKAVTIETEGNEDTSITLGPKVILQANGELDIDTAEKITLTTAGNKETDIEINTPLDIDTTKQVDIDLNGSNSEAFIRLKNKKTTVTSDATSPVEITTAGTVTINTNNDVTITSKNVDVDIEKIYTGTNRNIDEVDLDIEDSNINITGTSTIAIADLNTVNLEETQLTASAKTDVNLNAALDFDVTGQTTANLSDTTANVVGQLNVTTSSKAGGSETVHITSNNPVRYDANNTVTVETKAANTIITDNTSSTNITTNGTVTAVANNTVDITSTANVDIKGQQTVSGTARTPYEVKIESGKSTVTTSHLAVNDSIKFGSIATGDTAAARNTTAYIPVSGTSSKTDIRINEVLDLQSAKDSTLQTSSPSAGNGAQRANSLTNLSNYGLRLQNPSVDEDISKNYSKLYIENIEAVQRTFVNDADIHGNIRIGEFANANGFPENSNSEAAPTKRNTSSINVNVATSTSDITTKTEIVNSDTYTATSTLNATLAPDTTIQSTANKGNTGEKLFSIVVDDTAGTSTVTATNLNATEQFNAEHLRDVLNIYGQTTADLEIGSSESGGSNLLLRSGNGTGNVHIYARPTEPATSELNTFGVRVSNDEVLLQSRNIIEKANEGLLVTAPDFSLETPTNISDNLRGTSHIHSKMSLSHVEAKGRSYLNGADISSSITIGNKSSLASAEPAYVSPFANGYTAFRDAAANSFINADIQDIGIRVKNIEIDNSESSSTAKIKVAVNTNIFDVEDNHNNSNNNNIQIATNHEIYDTARENTISNVLGTYIKADEILATDNLYSQRIRDVQLIQGSKGENQELLIATRVNGASGTGKILIDASKAADYVHIYAGTNTETSATHLGLKVSQNTVNVQDNTVDIVGNTNLHLKGQNFEIKDSTSAVDLSASLSKINIDHLDVDEAAYIKNPLIHGTKILVGDLKEAEVNGYLPTSYSLEDYASQTSKLEAQLAELTAKIRELEETINNRKVTVKTSNIERYEGTNVVESANTVEEHSIYHLTGDSEKLIVETHSENEPDHVVEQNSRSYIQSDVLRTVEDFYANDFHIYWSDSINSLVFAHVNSSKLG